MSEPFDVNVVDAQRLADKRLLPFCDGNEQLYDFRARSDASRKTGYDPSKTVQSDMIDADINVIVARFGITGTMPNNMRIPTYGDYTEITDYRSALEAVTAAAEEFMRMPATVRAKFDNDPGLFLQFAENPANIEAMRELGLARSAEPQAIVVPPPVTPTA